MKNYTYRKYDAGTYPGHLSEQFKPTVGLSPEDEQMVSEVLAEQNAKMAPKEKMIKAVKQSGQPGATAASREDEEVDTTPWMPELYENGGDDDIIGKMSK